jgi:AraC family transcriptional regulator of adaptative response/methylated-DNA-[protein]-cysteine methyltransferase
MKSDYERVAEAIQFIVRNYRKPPRLEDISGEVGVSPFYFQRLFKRWAGIPLKQFMLFLSVEYTKGLIARSRSVLDTTFESGLSSPGRHDDHFNSLETVTPGEYKSNVQSLLGKWQTATALVRQAFKRIPSLFNSSCLFKSF